MGRTCRTRDTVLGGQLCHEPEGEQELGPSFDFTGPPLYIAAKIPAGPRPVDESSAEDPDAREAPPVTTQRTQKAGGHLGAWTLCPGDQV